MPCGKSARLRSCAVAVPDADRKTCGDAIIEMQMRQAGQPCTSSMAASISVPVMAWVRIAWSRGVMIQSVRRQRRL